MTLNIQTSFLRVSAVVLTLLSAFSSCAKADVSNGQSPADNGYIVVTEYGISNDGSEIGKELNRLVKDAYGSTLYFPAGTYNLTEPIKTPYDYAKNVNLVFDKNAHITSSKPLEALLMIGFTEMKTKDAGLRQFSYIDGGHFDATNTKRGIWVNGLKQLVTLRELSVYYCKGRHIEISCSDDFKGTGSSDTKLDNISIQGLSSNDDNYGIYIGQRCGDCKISDTFVYGTRCGLYTEGAGHIINNFHILTWRVGDGQTGDFAETVGVKIARQGFYQFSQVYFDTTNRDFVIEGDIDVNLIIDKCISHSYIENFGRSFISWGNGSGKLESKVSNCIFNLDYKPAGFKIFDIPEELILNDYESKITFRDNIVRSGVKLDPYDLSLMMKFYGRNAEYAFTTPQVIPAGGVVIGCVAPSASSNSLRIMHGEDGFTDLVIGTDGTLKKNETSSGSPYSVSALKKGKWTVLVLKGSATAAVNPEIIDLVGNSTFLSTPSKDKLFKLSDYGL